MDRSTVLFLLILGACSGGPPEDPAIARGRQAYNVYCVSCHNGDPSLPGPIGPELRGSSRELLEARVTHGGYPEGYTPKRQTTLMQPLPQVQPGEIDDMVAFINR